MNEATWLIALGVVGILIGAMFRWVPLLGPSSPWRLSLMPIAIVFGNLPRSLMPFGLACLLFGVGEDFPSYRGATLLIGVLMFLLGLLLMVWAPRWMQPKSLRG